MIDGSGFIFRAYHALPPMNRPDGTPVNAVFGFTTMLMKILGGTDADRVAVVFDSDRRTFRNDLYAAYKANRPEPPEDLIPQFALVREATAAFNVPCIELQGYEADDLIAGYARAAVAEGAYVTIVSSDKDLMQLVDDNVTLWDAMKDRVIDAEAVREKFGVDPDKVIDVQALAGDSIDNIPGVPGIGVKTAAQLIQTYGDLETLLARTDEIKQPKRRQSLIDHAEDARLSRKLVELHDDMPLPMPLDALAVKKADPAALRAFVESQAFRSLKARIDVFLKSPGEDAATADAPVRTFGDYTLVQDAETLRRWIDEAELAGTVAIDTETNSLNAIRADLVGVSLALAGGRACYIPLAHGGVGDLMAEPPRQVPFDEALALLKPMLENPATLKIGQNIKYDMEVLARHGIAVAPIDDTMLLSYVLEGGLHGHGLDELAELFLQHTTIKYADVAGSGKAQRPFAEVPLEQACAYAAEDADVTYRLHGALRPRLVEERLVGVYEYLERPLIPVLVAMERQGIGVDADRLRELSQVFAHRLRTLEAEIHGLAGRAFNVGSPKQLGEVLFDEMSLAGGKKGKTGAYGTGADVLETLAAEGHDLPARVLEWRQTAKLKSTYADALIDEINPDTGRVHTSYAQAVVNTGRLSSSDPNLQNIPIRTEEGRQIRQAFVADAGWLLLSADYSQIELRLLAHVAGIDALKEAFRAGHDIHAMTASQVFGVPLDAMDGDTRRRAKAINFGIIYGISAFGLSRQLGIPRKEAADYIDAYFARYPGIRDYMERTRAAARESGYVTTLFGRRCHVRGLNDKNPSARGFAERAAINAPIQGGAADIIKRAMIRLPKALADAGLRARMLLQVHDELVFEVPENEVDATRDVVTREMQGVASLDVPLVCDTGVGANWSDAH